MKHVIVLGSLMTDLVMRAPRMPVAGESLIGDDFGIFSGGKGCNQAVAAARSGATVVMIGKVGDDAFGQAFYPLLDREHIDARFVMTDPHKHSGIASITIAADTGQNAIVVAPGANLAITASEIERAFTLINPQTCDIFLCQCETGTESYTAALKLARQRGMLTILNAAPAPREELAADVYHTIDILIVNEVEAALLSDVAVDSPATAIDAAHVLRKKGPSQVIVTMGAQGFLVSTLRDDGAVQDEYIAPVQVQQIDATAAGDAMCGTLVAALAAEMDWDRAIQRANIAGALTVTRKGAIAALPTAEEIDAFMQRLEQ